MPEAAYSIIRTAPTVYLDDMGNAVNGYLLTVYLKAFDETHQVRVSSTKAAEAKAECEKLVDWRQALANLGT